jgi:hypothetical protein
MQHIVIYLVFFLSGICEISCGNEHIMDWSILLPEKVHKWYQTREEQIYTRDKLYGYIDGGAELYLSYGFNSLYNCVYEAQNSPDLIVDIFDMGNSENAFGIFSHSRDTIESIYGQGSQYTEGLLLFWKDRFYISILASPETPDSKEAVFSLASFIDDHIQREGKLPSIIQVLPRQNLIEKSIRFFHHHFWLNAHYFISNDNILRINENTDVLLAKYANEKRSPVCILVKYKSIEQADSGRVNFIHHFLPELKKNPVTVFEDGSWCGAAQNNSIVAIILNADKKITVMKLMESLKWQEK